MQNEEVLDAVCITASTSASQVTYGTGLSQSADWCTLHEEQLCLFHFNV
jgi:hypothetical protein